MGSIIVEYCLRVLEMKYFIAVHTGTPAEKQHICQEKYGEDNENIF